MQRELGAVVPNDEPAPWGAILWLAFVSIGGLLSACSMLVLLLVMLERTVK